MKAVMVMYDSLNRHMLPNYGCDWTLAPNFIRLGERTRLTLLLLANANAARLALCTP